MLGFLKVFGGLAAVGGLMQSCAGGVTQGATNVDNFVHPQTCEDTVDGTTGTTVLEDGSVFGVMVMPDGSKALTHEYGLCHR